MVAPSDFSVHSGELTPTLKVKRHFILKKYEKEIDDLYNMTSSNTKVSDQPAFKDIEHVSPAPVKLNKSEVAIFTIKSFLHY